MGGPKDKVPNPQERRRLQELGGMIPQEDEAGKARHSIECTGCHDGVKLKSRKFVKTNIDIKKQEQWPHVNMMQKYAQKTTFDSMDFDKFVAGETRVIANIKNSSEKQGRLQVLCKLAHWLCKSKDWGVVKGLFEAIIES